MKLKKFHSIVENTPENVKAHVRLSMDILDRINELLDKKFEGKQKLLAEKMGKSEAEVSKWLNGVQNFTTKTLVKLELAFGEPIIAVCTHDEDKASTYVLAKSSKSLSVTWVVDKNGHLDEQSDFENIPNIHLTTQMKTDLPA